MRRSPESPRSIFIAVTDNAFYLPISVWFPPIDPGRDGVNPAYGRLTMMIEGRTGTRLEGILTVEARNRLRRLSPRRNAARVLRRIAQRLHPSLLESVVVKRTAGQRPYVDIRMGKNQRVTGYVDPAPETGIPQSW